MNEEIQKAIKKYDFIWNIIADITEENYNIEVSHFASLFNIVFDTNSIEAKHINKILNKLGATRKIYDNEYNKRKKNGLIPSRYEPADEAIYFSEKIIGSNWSFYVWDPKFVFSILGIDFISEIDEKVVKKLCKLMKKYVREKFNIATVTVNLKALKIILEKYMWKENYQKWVNEKVKVAIIEQSKIYNEKERLDNEKRNNKK